jgi:thioredoxin 2
MSEQHPTGGAAQAGGRSTTPDRPTVTPSPVSGPVSNLTCASCGKLNRIRPSPRGVPTCGSCGATLPWLVAATDDTFDQEAAASVMVLVDLWAPWCGPCRMVAPILEQLSREYAGRIKVVKVNVDENPLLQQRFRAMSIPTLIVMRDGRVVDRIVGALPKSDLAVRLTPYLLRR